MYPGAHAVARARQPVQVMGRSGEILTYAEYEARANRLAHWLRDFGLRRLDHFAVFMENHPRFLECGAAGYRAGLYYTYVNCYLTAEELAWRFRERLTSLIPAPLYHSAPAAAAGLTILGGGMVVVMEKFDPEGMLALIERHRVQHVQVVPTMFSRLLKLPERVRRRYDLSSLEVVLHGAAPCPIPIKKAIIDWLGPIVHEYYAATEAMGMTMCDSHQWLEHKGTVGKAVFGEAHILDDEMNALPAGRIGKVWFKSPTRIAYFHDEAKSAKANSPDGTMSTVGDVGYLDDEGYLYLTDRAAFMIISGGVNIYPQECENLLITHPKVADAAVFGVPNADLGEGVKAVVQPALEAAAGPELEAELIAFCRAHLAHIKCPRSIDFEAEFPRLPTGKLYKQPLRDRYWKGHTSRIL